MRLYFFRSTPDISLEQMEEVAERVSRVFTIDYSIFTGPVVSSPDQVTVEDLLSISDQFLSRSEPVVAVVFIRAKIQDDESILGQGSEPHRGAWVMWSDDPNRITLITIHELGHICEAEHCVDESCIMYHVYRERRGSSMEKLFCRRCLSIVRESWVYTRLKQASEDRIRKGNMLPKIVQTPRISVASQPAGMRFAAPTPVDPIQPPVSTFPPWPRAWENKDEFLRRVKEYFGIRDEE